MRMDQNRPCCVVVFVQRARACFARGPGIAVAVFVKQKLHKSPSKGIWPLLSLNFFMADMQAGIGPFLGVFLLAHGWESGLIGTVMTVGGIAGMLMTTPAGALVDGTKHKKLYVIIPGICAVIGSGIV